MMSNVRRTPLQLFALLIFAGACTNPVSPHEGGRVERFLIVAGEDTLVTGDRLTYSDTLRLQPGQPVASVQVLFLRHGAIAQLGSDYHLEVRFQPSGIAAFEASSPGAFTGVLRGEAVGIAELTVHLMHGRPGSPFVHSDFDGARVPVVVAPAGSPGS